MKKTKLTTILALSLISTSLLISTGCSSSKVANGQVEEVPFVQVIKLQQNMGSGFMASGKITPEQQVKIVSKVSGKVTDIKVKEGSVVKQGDLLIQLDGEDQALQVKQAQAGMEASQAKLADIQAGARKEEIKAAESAVNQAEAAVTMSTAGVEQAQTAYDLALKTLDRTKNLFSQGAMSGSELDKVTVDMERAKSGLGQARAQLASSKAQLAAAQAKYDLTKTGATGETIKALQADVNRMKSSYDLAQNTFANTRITAPTDGVIIKREIEPGEMVQQGVSLLTLVKMDRVHIQVSVPQEQVNKVKVGNQVNIRVQSVDSPDLTGIIEFVSPVSDVNNTTFPVKLVVDNQQGKLRAGMTAEVFFEGSSASQLELPKTAIVEKEDRQYVYKVVDNRVQQVEVTTKEKNANWVYVQQGLDVKDQVIVHPDEHTTDGVQVRVK